MTPLRELVDAWQRQVDRRKAAFAEAVDAINRELATVGGYATTSPDEKGYCRSYLQSDDGFGGGVERVGERFGGRGPHADVVAPHHPEVGNRCFELEQAWRREAVALSVARTMVRDCIKKLGGSEDAEHAALALCRSERGEREAIVRWLRTGYPGADRVRETRDLIESIADAIERGDHLRNDP